MSVTSELTALKNYTTKYLNETDTLTGAESQNLTQSDFLRLLTQQLQYQDPMDPQDNSQFVTQLCQFSQLEVSTETYEVISDYTGNTRASSLVGQTVTITDPENTSTTITGQVTSAFLDGADSGITINGTTYPMDYLLYTFGSTAPTTEETGS